MTSEMARQGSMLCKFGSSCEIPFIAKEYCDLNIQWKHLEPYLNDRPSLPWTEIGTKSPSVDDRMDVESVEEERIDVESVERSDDRMDVESVEEERMDVESVERSDDRMDGGKKRPSMYDKIRLKNRNTKKRQLLSRKRRRNHSNETQKRKRERV